MKTFLPLKVEESSSQKELISKEGNQQAIEIAKTKPDPTHFQDNGLDPNPAVVDQDVGVNYCGLRGLLSAAVLCAAALVVVSRARQK